MTIFWSFGTKLILPHFLTITAGAQYAAEIGQQFAAIFSWHGKTQHTNCKFPISVCPRFYFRTHTRLFSVSLRMVFTKDRCALTRSHMWRDALFFTFSRFSSVNDFVFVIELNRASAFWSWLPQCQQAQKTILRYKQCTSLVSSKIQVRHMWSLRPLQRAAHALIFFHCVHTYAAFSIASTCRTNWTCRVCSFPGFPINKVSSTVNTNWQHQALDARTKMCHCSTHLIQRFKSAAPNTTS